MIERRRGARVKSSFLIAVAGIDQSAQVRKGDISFSGIYFDTDRSIGEAGSVVRLSVATFEGARRLEVMGRVVREFRREDYWRGDQITGVALQFLFASPQQQKDMEQFVRTVVQLQATRARNLQLHYKFPAQIETREQAAPERDAVIQFLTQEGMVMETAFPVTVGEAIEVQVQTRSTQRSVRLAGEAINIEREEHDDGSVRFVVQVRFAQPDAAPRPLVTPGRDVKAVGYSIADALDALVSDTAVPQSPEDPFSGVRHMGGSLKEIALPSLLSFLELERRSGVLKLTRESEKAEIYVASGQIVDVETIPPREALALLLEWPDGDFDLAFHDVVRPDKLGTSTTSLLLDLMREKDEREK
jgi:hypothetical protein